MAHPNPAVPLLSVPPRDIYLHQGKAMGLMLLLNQHSQHPYKGAEGLLLLTFIYKAPTYPAALYNKWVTYIGQTE
ncbi:hypothetical protein XENTR_v10003096 [Xenopus tropicalis]|nr:hypothetical protein XENTR_v10003096 [Xenopus tropicalis]